MSEVTFRERFYKLIDPDNRCLRCGTGGGPEVLGYRFRSILVCNFCDQYPINKITFRMRIWNLILWIANVKE